MKTLNARQVKMLVQQDPRGISEGDLVQLPSGELAQITKVTAAGAQAEPIGIDRGEFDKAAKSFRKFAGKPGDRVLTMPAKALSGPGWKLGDLCGVLYEADLAEGKQLFYHPFRKKSRPTLAVLHNGSTLATLGGAFRVSNERGIVDLK